ncbi:aminodeoxychorismate/anthranilate synthase component II [Desulfohalobiaceae bacterium Ax17]|uniref:anthranilate synthase component II n=1 Tax=Desulfovulcanus ferrireducens TaxID=2831190 RepID=UPI00207BC634|nr:aminodeoxychorismate/anthranilate synthase component II [Desulfovulcanus ferrireducens]MBT8762619.1 aminodeoxychorismate/anthranilate synthase component II [Desulfovulcanus ferrireducens]
MILLIDNFDSFTFNLVQVLQKMGHDPVVLRNNDESLFSYVNDPELTAVIISPGPSSPENSGLCLEFLSKLKPEIPVLGVCLGHQILGYYAGAKVEVADEIMHGKTSLVYHDHKGLFKGLPNPMQVCRYHSLVVVPQKDSLFSVTARTEDNKVMGLCYFDRPWMGVQFHPESILTPDGPKLVQNFIEMLG